jgi:HAD superfamily hydrolase (TIGR01549 family)
LSNFFDIAGPIYDGFVKLPSAPCVPLPQGGDAMRFDGMIFDIEGTLIDCIPQNLRSWQETLSSFGLTVPIEDLQRYSGMDGDDMLQILAADMNKKLRQRALEAEGKNFEAKYLKSVRPFAGVRPLFEAIKRAGGKIAVATDCKDPELKYYRAVLGVDDLIDVITCGEDVKEGKPSPKLVRLAAERLRVDPHRAVMTGDTPYDAQAARGAGISALGVLTGGFSQQTLKDAGCFAAIKEVSDMRLFLASPEGSARVDETPSLPPGFS